MRFRLVNYLLALIPVFWYFGRSNSNFVSLMKRAQVAYTLPPSPLNLWTEFFKSVRQVSRAGAVVPIPDISNFSMSAVTGLLPYYLPVIIIIGILVLGALVLMFSACGMCFVMFRNKGMLRKKFERMEPSTPLEKYFAWFLFGLPFFVIGICIAAHIGGINYSTQGLYAVEDSTVNMITQATQLLGNATSTLNNVVGNIKGIASTSIDMTASSIDFNQMDILVLPPLTNLTNGYQNIQTQVSALKIVRDNTTTNITTLKTMANTAVTDTNAVNSNIQALSTTNQPITGSPGKTWILKNAVVFTAASASEIVNKANSAPNVGNILNNLNFVPDLSSYITDAASGVNTVKSTSQQTILSSASSLKTTINGSFDTGRDSALSSITPAINQGSTMLNGVKASMQAEYVKVNTYNDTRVIVQYVLVLLYALPILFITMMGVSRKPRIMKTCNLVCVPYYVLLFLLSVLFFIMAVVVGDACDLAFDNNSPLLTTVSPVSIALGAVDQCYNGSSLITVASALGVGINASQFNLSSIAGNQIESVNFSSVSNFDISSNLDMVPDPAPPVQPIRDLVLTNLNAGTLGDISATTVPQIRTALSNIVTVLQTLRTNADTNSLNYGGAPSPAEQTQAVTDLRTRIDTIITSINAISSVSGPVGTLQQIANLADSLVTTLTNLAASATSLQSLANSMPTYYTNAVANLNAFSTAAKNNVTAIIPAVKSNIVNSIGTQQTALLAAFGCQAAAVEFMKARQGLCGNFSSSLDAFWSSLAIMALWSLFSLPITVYVANKLFVDLMRFKNASADPEFKNDDGNKSTDNGNKGLGVEPVFKAVFDIYKRIISTKAASPAQVSPEKSNIIPDNLEDPPIAQVDDGDEDDEFSEEESKDVEDDDSESEYDDDDDKSIVPEKQSTVLKPEQRKGTIKKSGSNGFDVDKEFGDLDALISSPIPTAPSVPVAPTAPPAPQPVPKQILKEESEESEDESEEEESEEESETEEVAKVPVKQNESEESEESDESEQRTPEPKRPVAVLPTVVAAPVKPVQAAPPKIDISDEKSPIDLAIEEKQRAKEKKRLEEEEMKKKFNWLESKGLVNKAKTLFDDEEEAN